MKYSISSTGLYCYLPGKSYCSPWRWPRPTGFRGHNRRRSSRYVAIDRNGQKTWSRVSRSYLVSDGCRTLRSVFFARSRPSYAGSWARTINMRRYGASDLSCLLKSDAYRSRPSTVSKRYSISLGYGPVRRTYESQSTRCQTPSFKCNHYHHLSGR